MSVTYKQDTYRTKALLFLCYVDQFLPAVNPIKFQLDWPGPSSIRHKKTRQNDHEFPVHFLWIRLFETIQSCLYIVQIFSMQIL